MSKLLQRGLNLASITVSSVTATTNTFNMVFVNIIIINMVYIITNLVNIIINMVIGQHQLEQHHHQFINIGVNIDVNIMKHTFIAAPIMIELLLSLIRKALQMILIRHMQFLKKNSPNEISFVSYSLCGERVV